MNIYRYIARNSNGQRVEGVMQGETSHDILVQLRDKALTPLTVEPHTDKIAAGKKRVCSWWPNRIRSEEIASFCWQLGTMLEAGVPITEAFETIAEDIDNLTFRSVVEEIGETIKSGETLTEAVQAYPTVFNGFFHAVVLAGESSGSLTTSLARLADYYEHRDSLKRRIIQAVSYPFFTIGFVVLVVIVMMVFVVPRFIDIFAAFENTLPFLTRWFIQLYNLLHENMLIFMPLLVVAIPALVLYSRTVGGRRVGSRLVLRLPITGKLLRFAFAATFGRTMGTLLESGVPILEALRIVKGLSTNHFICDALDDMCAHVAEGESIARSMKFSGFFPRLMVKTVQVGEYSGSLPEVLYRVSACYERKVDSAIGNMLRLLEPMLIIAVGAIVLFVLLVLYMPVFSMSNIGDSI
ncbi:MAG TPA: type II secretion system F family protein [Anaerohalosphaeraceae bacterium]|nr:type II secretion system F family protein [Anaerohalosphaeraceae bacterium]HRT51748.1 type II secretion system F family protein [Anaerohalosphaeraceae bacterium]HRT87938.1 type II secretion system F family protein [Anaerohalosphaeraceae bacterium]